MENDEKSLDQTGFSDITTECDAPYIILARIAEMYLEGSYGVEKCCQEAAGLLNEAAEKAMQFGKGRLADKYYNMAEKALAS
jgi:elongation factor 2 kinase